MPRTPDRRAGPLEEEEIRLEDRTADGDPVVEGAIRRVGGCVRILDSTGVYDPREARGSVLIPRSYDTEVSVPSSFTLLWHDITIEDGVDLIVEDGGEVLSP